ncbi:MAG: hypothetical protein NVV72_00975 [Asticcacaulis sp.]|nr:hypothetical protein [Asticcacaulis sp.]
MTAASLVNQIQSSARKTPEAGTSAADIQRAWEDIQVCIDRLNDMFLLRKHSLDNKPSHGESDQYWSEKLGNLQIFAEMALKPESRESYGLPQIEENISHFGYLVERMARGNLPA